MGNKISNTSVLAYSAIGSGIVLFASYLYLSNDKQDEENLKKDEITNENSVEKAIANNFQIEMNGELYSAKTVKKAFMRSAILALPVLRKLKADSISFRRSEENFKNIPAYTESLHQYFQSFYQIMSAGLDKCLEYLKMDKELFLSSRDFYIQSKEVARTTYRDIAWGYLANEESKLNLSKEALIAYIELQIKYNEKATLDMKDHLRQSTQIQSSFYPALLGIRVDDYVFFESGIDEVDYLKSLQLHSGDEEIQRILIFRGESANNLIKELIK